MTENMAATTLPDRGFEEMRMTRWIGEFGLVDPKSGTNGAATGRLLPLTPRDHRLIPTARLA
jgi:hypothetical protein